MGLFDIGASIIDATAGFFSAKQQNDMAVGNAREAQRFSASQAADQMSFQERISNTSHQREIADLKAAGLNPLMSLNSGASTPGGAMGNGVAAPVVPELGAAYSSAREGIRLRNDLKLLRAHTSDAESKAGLSSLELRYAKHNPNAYFTAKQGGVNTLVGRTLGSISSSANSVKPSWRNLIDRIPGLDVADDYRYMSDSEMRRRGEERRRSVSDKKFRNSSKFNRRHSN